MDNDKYEDIVNAVYTHDLYGYKTDVKLDFVQYRNNGTIALQLLSRSDEDEMPYMGTDKEFCSPYAVVTVNLPDSDTLAVNEQFVDENNLPGIGQWLLNTGIAYPTEHFCQSGYCTYQAYAFNVPDRILNETLSCREDCVAQNLIDVIENSNLKPDEVNERGELYNLKAAGEHPDPPVIVYKGTDPEHLGKKNDIFLLAYHREKGEQMWRFRNLPSSVRRQVTDSIAMAVRQSSRLKR